MLSIYSLLWSHGNQQFFLMLINTIKIWLLFLWLQRILLVFSVHWIIPSTSVSTLYCMTDCLVKCVWNYTLLIKSCQCLFSLVMTSKQSKVEIFFKLKTKIWFFKASALQSLDRPQQSLKVQGYCIMIQEYLVSNLAQYLQSKII